MEQNSEPRNKHMHIWLINLWQRNQEYTLGKGVTSKNGDGKTRQPHAKEWKLDHYLTPYTKINSKWIKNLNITKEVIKVLKENMGSKVLDTGLGNDFLSLTPKAKINK